MKNTILISLLFLSITLSSICSADHDVMFGFPDIPSTDSSLMLPEEDVTTSRLPTIERFSDLPDDVISALESHRSEDEITPHAFGTGGHPFTTKRATPRNKLTKNIEVQMMKEYPFAPTGKLYMRFGNFWYVCTASVVKKGVVATAAHCVWDWGFGTAGAADEVIYQPARTGDVLPFTQWAGRAWIVPTVYANGTDVCHQVGVICENDIALVVLHTNHIGRHIKNVIGGRYVPSMNSYGFTNFAGLESTQITQLGYPVSLAGGTKMIRTDSIGYMASPNNIIIGSDQTGGSSGGPWLINFGRAPSRDRSNPAPLHNVGNRIVGVTSWGYVDHNIKIQGASRFGTNTAFPSTSNIDVLIEAACSAFPSNCGK